MYILMPSFFRLSVYIASNASVSVQSYKLQLIRRNDENQKLSGQSISLLAN